MPLIELGALLQLVVEQMMEMAGRYRYEISKPASTAREAGQELIDDLVIKFRIVRFLRTREYNQLFSGDPTGVTEFIAGIGEDGRTLVTNTPRRRE